MRQCADNEAFATDHDFGSLHVAVVTQFRRRARITASTPVAGDAAEQKLTTALRLGAELGWVFGKPSFPIILGVNGAWLPGVTYQDKSHDSWSLGASLGIFVPFLDLN